MNSSVFPEPQPPQPLPRKPTVQQMRTEYAELEWPPGNAGDIARLIHSAAIRPVREVSIAATLGLLAGVFGRGWSVSNAGLNTYCILVGKSGIGKESLHSGVGMIVNEVGKRHPGLEKRFQFSNFASGPALSKTVAENPCFTNVVGEFGQKLKRMANPRDDAMGSFREQMTNLYPKSGPAGLGGGINYSNKEKNTVSVRSPAFSLVGETTPGTFLECLTPSMMEEGFMSRFIIIEYAGERPPENPNPIGTLPEGFVPWFAEFASYADSIESSNLFITVQFSEEAAVLRKAFDKECDSELYGLDDEAQRQVWNRAALKALKIAAQLAVIDNQYNPQITAIHLQWAIDLVKRNIDMFLNHLTVGNVGDSDDARKKKVIKCMWEWQTKPLSGNYVHRLGWKILHEKGIVPKAYIRNRLNKVNAFAAHRQGSDAAIDATLRTLVNDGTITMVSRADLVKDYDFRGEAYMPLDVVIFT